MIRASQRNEPPSRRRLRAARARRARQRRLFGLVLIMLAVLLLIIWLIAGRDSSESTASIVKEAQASAGAERGEPDEPGSGGQNGPDASVPDTAAQPQEPPFEVLDLPVAMPNPPQVVKIPILMFHHVGETPPGADATRIGLTVSAIEFESMMAYLKQAGYHTVSQPQLFKSLYSGQPLPEHPVMLTFDDGYLDNFEIALPALEKYGFVATFNVIPDKVGTGEYMSWEQVAQLDRKGMDVGSHTLSHPDLTTLAAPELKRELADSGAVISSHLGHPVYWLCYPAGEYDEDVIGATRDAGYLLAVTTEPGEQHSSDAPFTISRYRVRNDTGLEGFKELVR